jgi:hypothetical protein
MPHHRASMKVKHQKHGLLAITAWSLCLLAAATGQQSSPGVAKGNQSEPRTPTAYVDLVEVRVVGAEEPLKPIPRPLFSYSDSVRQIAEGGIWAWGEGRPIAMIKSWRNADGRRTRAFSMTSTELVTAHGPQARVWRPGVSEALLRPLPGAPTPERNESARLRQLKEQSRRFSAYERWDPENARFEMRLLVQPVHRYHDPDRQIEDGAVFLLAVETNPQILLFIEMLSSERDVSRWQFLLARVSSAELHVALDGEEVWNQGRTPGIVGKPTDSYWHMVTLPLDGSAP